MSCIAALSSLEGSLTPNPLIWSIMLFYYGQIERLRITFTSNGKRKFVPRDQVSSHKWVVSRNVLSIRIVLSCFYLLIPELNLTFAASVYIKLSLSNIKQLGMKHLVCPDRGGGVLRILIDGDDRRIFRSLKFSIPGSFWVGKFGRAWFK